MLLQHSLILEYGSSYQWIADKIDLGIRKSNYRNLSPIYLLPVVLAWGKK